MDNVARTSFRGRSHNVDRNGLSWWHARCTIVTSMIARRAIDARLLLPLCVSISAWLPGVACGGRGHAAANTAQVPPAEEPPWTKAATVTPDAGAGRRGSEERPGNSSTETTNDPEPR